MARLARIVIPGLPHFITQRGDRGENVFFNEDDALFYQELLGEQSRRFGLAVWAYCLMPGRVHLLAVPENENSLSRAFGETHRQYSNRINERRGTSGNLWQSRFSSFPLDEPYILPAAYFIETTPVMAGLCKDPSAFRWSSARAHAKGADDPVCAVKELLRRGYAPSSAPALPPGADGSVFAAHISTGRPLGNTAFIERLEKQTGRALKKRKPGRKPVNTNKPRLLAPDAADQRTRGGADDFAALIERVNRV